MNIYSRFITFILFVLLAPTISFAALLEVVSNTNDAGPGSLRQALADVDPFGTVRFDPGIEAMTITLTSGELVIDKQVSIIGTDAPNVFIDGSATADIDVIRIADATGSVFFGTINITGNAAQNAISVGMTSNLTATNLVTLDSLTGVVVDPTGRFDGFDSTFQNHQGAGARARGGFGGSSGGVFSCDECLFSGNPVGVSAEGGLSTNDGGGSAGVSESVITSNGIGMRSTGGTTNSAPGGRVSARQSLFSNNNFGIEAAAGGTDSAGGGSLEVLSSTITTSAFAAIRVSGGSNDTTLGGTAKVSFTGIRSNLEDGLQVDPPTNGNAGLIEIKNSYISGSLTQDCDAAMSEIVATGLNIDDDGTCSALSANFVTFTPMLLNLGPLQNNGGMTDTFDLLIPSVAIDAAPDCTDVDGGTVDFDQRLFPRPFGASCDIGPVEQQPTGMLTINKLSVPPGGTGFTFGGDGFPLGCEFNIIFSMDDGETLSCIIPPAVVTITDILTSNAGVNFDCDENPTNQTFDSITLDIAAGDDVTCTLTNDTRELILNEIFPGLASNFNIISATEATPEGKVAFIWGFQPGNVTINGPTCNGLELDIKSPRLLSMVDAFDDGDAEYIFWIPLIGDFELPILTQAIDVDTCRKSEVVLNIIRKE